jgi:xanthine dehydrogenase accessory factor
VMTHSHPLDEAVCEAILRREDFAYLGLIGSATKRARFVKRLGHAGIAPEQLKRLICPIGLPNIASKEPTAIAASVAADLLIRREQSSLTTKGAVLRGG